MIREPTSSNARAMPPPALDLAPPDDPRALDASPWPIRVHTLGPLQLWRGGERIVFAGKVPRKALHLLRALVALGGRDVASSTVADVLWPEAEGDAARGALDITVHRLRRLLGRADAIVVQDRRLSIHARVCWVDALALARAIARCAARLARSGVADDATLHDADRIVTWYRGPFLPGVEEDIPLVVSMRERLRADLGRLLRALDARGGQSARPGRWRGRLNALCARDPGLARHGYGPAAEGGADERGRRWAALPGEPDDRDRLAVTRRSPSVCDP